MIDFDESKRLHLVSISSSHRGESNVGTNDIEWIALAAFKKGKRASEKRLKISEAIASSGVFVMSNEIAGNKIKLNFISYMYSYCEDILNKLNLSGALAIIASPLLTVSRDKFTNKYPLGAMLNYELDRIGTDFPSEMYKQVSKGYIQNISVKLSKEVLLDIDELSRDELLSFYKIEKWPTYTVEIEVYDEAWIQHFKKISFYDCVLDGVSESLVWTEAFRKWRDFINIAYSSKRNIQRDDQTEFDVILVDVGNSKMY